MTPPSQNDSWIYVVEGISSSFFSSLIPRQRISSRETVYAKFAWLRMNDSIELSNFFRLRGEYRTDFY